MIEYKHNKGELFFFESQIVCQHGAQYERTIRTESSKKHGLMSRKPALRQDKCLHSQRKIRIHHTYKLTDCQQRRRNMAEDQLGSRRGHATLNHFPTSILVAVRSLVSHYFRIRFQPLVKWSCNYSFSSVHKEHVGSFYFVFYISLLSCAMMCSCITHVNICIVLNS